jgi:hypothetical protein
MDVLLAFAVIGFVAWWIRYNQLYSSGAVKTPFFSLGQAQPRQVRGQHRVDRPTSVATPGQQRAISQAVARITTYTHNQDVSVRLLRSTCQANMSKSLEWCTDKTIEDIIRDRR